MIGAVRNERLVAIGHRAKKDYGSDTSAIAEPIAGTLFLGPRTIDVDGWLREDTELPVEEWSGYRGPFFDRVHFRAADVVALWPNPTVPIAMNFSSPFESGVVLLSGGPPTNDQTSPNGLSNLAVSAAALRDWYIERRDAWPAEWKNPSQDEDLSDAREHFASRRVTRAAVRKIRAAHAPQTWTAFGCRKLAQK
jgi:hypothetical protein